LRGAGLRLAVLGTRTAFVVSRIEADANIRCDGPSPQLPECGSMEAA
jgi:hypothetical protein